MSLVSSAHRNDLDVWACVDDVLRQLLAGSTNYCQFLPWAWATSHPQHIRQYRQEERTTRSSLQQSHRASRRSLEKILPHAKARARSHKT